MKMRITYGPEFKINFNQGEKTMGLSPLEAGKKIDELIKKYRFDHPEISYQTAMKRVLEVNPKLKELYARTQVTFPADAAEFKADAGPRAERAAAGQGEDNQAVRNHVNQLVLLKMQLTGEEDYEVAMEKVFEARPELKIAYAKS